MPDLPRDVNDDTGNSFYDAIRNRSAHVVHVTHNDLDAVGADAIHRMKYGNDGVFTIWSSVGRFSGLFSMVAACRGNGDLVSISDIGYRKGAENTVARARQNGWRVEWRDHHRWEEGEIAAVRAAADLLRIDTASCATGIVARDLLPEHPGAAEVARVVCDYDLWKNTDPRSAVLGQVLQRKINRDHVRDCLAAGIFTDERIESQFTDIRREMRAMMRKSLRHATVLGKKYRIAFAPLYGYPSETAHFIRDELHTDMEVIIGRDGKFSLRSVPPISHRIAREFSGGGHPNASGGTFNFTVFERFLYWLLKKTRYMDEFVRVAESCEA
ncbi:MAG TPA: phosphoesterase [Methanoregulaceae archaeon]|nr:phosphoesterase [Methanoregulaceae archaeon]HRY76531.1 phosphoesterase [Methanoregulaceae archaeon]